MKKIISLFKRDYEGTRNVYDEVVPGAEWVIAGEGVATRKWDGTCCLIRGGKMYKRYDRKLDKKSGKHKDAPDGWEAAQGPDENTGHWPGWSPIGDGPEDKYFREAIDPDLDDGTYELCGPRINGNPEDCADHILIAHGLLHYLDAPRSFNELRDWFTFRDVEGLVWHHPDGRMVKIKKRDFGLRRNVRC